MRRGLTAVLAGLALTPTPSPAGELDGVSVGGRYVNQRFCFELRLPAAMDAHRTAAPAPDTGIAFRLRGHAHAHGFFEAVLLHDPEAQSEAGYFLTENRRRADESGHQVRDDVEGQQAHGEHRWLHHALTLERGAGESALIQERWRLLLDGVEYRAGLDAPTLERESAQRIVEQLLREARFPCAPRSERVP